MLLKAFGASIGLLLLHTRLSIAQTPEKTLKTVQVYIAPNPILSNDTTCMNGGECSAPETRTVTYFVAKNLAIIDGDVIYGTEDEIIESSITNNSKRAYSIWPFENARKWPFGIVPYQYEDAATESGRGPKFEEAIKRWTNKLPFLSFVNVGVNSVPSVDVLMVRAIEDSTSYSYVGYVPFPQVLLGRPDLPETDYWYTHSIGHTLGLMHEHQRPDRPLMLTLECDKVATTATSPPTVCTNPCSGTGCYFSVLSFLGDPNMYSGTYDIESIMHFNPSDFAKDPADPPLKPISPVVFNSGRLNPTITDANRVCDIYYLACRGVCGDGILALANGEDCDDGNNIDGDGCSETCKIDGDIPHCGNGVVETALGEMCEPPGTSTCDANCQLIEPPNPCGNGILEPGLGETCEPPNTPTCDANCQQIITLPGTCPAPCNPNVPNNLCHDSTSCIPLQGATGNPGLPFGLNYMCACAAGFRADGIDPTDASKQVRFSNALYTSWVFVEPGTSCLTECSPDTNPFPCQEVPQKDECW